MPRLRSALCLLALSPLGSLALTACPGAPGPARPLAVEVTASVPPVFAWDGGPGFAATDVEVYRCAGPCPEAAPPLDRQVAPPPDGGVLVWRVHRAHCTEVCGGAIRSPLTYGAELPPADPGDAGEVAPAPPVPGRYQVRVWAQTGTLVSTDLAWGQAGFALPDGG